MKRKLGSQIQSCEIRLPSHEQAKSEIQSFLRAVDSYPARVAENPALTFHQHLRSLLASAQSHCQPNPRAN